MLSICYIFLQDTEGTIRQIADFLGKKLTDEQVARIKEHCEFENMKENPAVNYNLFSNFGVKTKDAKEMLRRGNVYRADFAQSYFGPLMQRQIQILPN